MESMLHNGMKKVYNVAYKMAFCGIFWHGWVGKVGTGNNGKTGWPYLFTPFDN